MNLDGFHLGFFTMLKRGLPNAICCIPVLVVGILIAVGAFFVRNGMVLTMDVNSLFLLMVGLACPIGMGLMMWLMHKYMSHSQAPSSPESNQKGIGAAKRLAELHEQRQILDAEIAALSQGIEQDEQPPSTIHSEPTSVPEGSPISALR